MKLIFLSNYYNHHQKPSCEAWHRLTGGDFRFVAMEEFSQERKAMGWGDERAEFVVQYQADTAEAIKQQVCEADVVIYGSAPLSVVSQRLQASQPVFKYSERIYKRGSSLYKWPVRTIRFRRELGRYKKLYLLAASAYAPGDFAQHGVFRNKSYRWGYFPEAKRYEITELLTQKHPVKLLWCGRMLSWKHPEAALEVLRRLQENGVDAQLHFVGSGELEQSLRRQAEPLGDRVIFHGSMSPEQVRREMETASIYLATSDFNEGWGAVINEAMNSGCAVVASHAMGAAPYLIDHGTNGLLYESGNVDGLYRKVQYLLTHPEIRESMGLAAYHTITQVWNAQVATERFLALSEALNQGKPGDLYPSGPCSKAPILKNNWFREEEKFPVE